MKSAFCCASLKTGTLIVGWVSLVLTVLYVLFIASVYALMSEQNENEQGDAEQDRNLTVYQDMNNITTINWGSSPGVDMLFITFAIFHHPYAILSTAVLNTIVLAGLLYGTYKNHPALLIPYLFLYIIKTVLSVLIAIFWFAVQVPLLIILQIIFPAPINIYCITVVWSYYKHLRKESKDSKNNVSYKE